MSNVSSRLVALEALFAPLTIMAYMESREDKSVTFYVAAYDENGPVPALIDGDTFTALAEALQCEEICVDNDVGPGIYQSLPVGANPDHTPILRVTARRAKVLSAN